jgi:hypothetical protein
MNVETWFISFKNDEFFAAKFMTLFYEMKKREYV